MTEKQLLSKAMAILGSSKSPAKQAASRENGKKGGRPRKNKQKDLVVVQQVENDGEEY